MNLNEGAWDKISTTFWLYKVSVLGEFGEGGFGSA
jgi:hypothetical protein